MSQRASNSPHLLEEESPAFLALLDREPAKARSDFCRFAYRVLQACPPRPLRWMLIEEREEAVQEILLHCLKDDCRALRLYRPEGRAFAAWFIRVAYFKALDIWRRRRTLEALGPDHQDPHPGPQEKDLLARDRVRDILASMGDKCRLLLALLMDGLKPREMATVAMTVLGYSSYSNVQASNDLRYCKGVFMQRARERGLATG